MGRIASFHLVSERGVRASLTFPRLGTDRLALRRTPGLEFVKVLGTGRGSSTGPGVDVRRAALFAVWSSDADLDEFLATSAIGRRWAGAAEAWHVRLRRRGGHGRWSGVDPLDGLESGARDGAVAVLTRARVRPRAWRAFSRASREVDRELHGAAGLVDVVGVGELPIGTLATFSLWESTDAVRAYAYATARHQRVIDQTREGSWYSEELFARFEPYGSAGSWNGRDPLAGLTGNISPPPR
jgi:hypothetical protein